MRPSSENRNIDDTSRMRTTSGPLTTSEDLRVSLVKGVQLFREANITFCIMYGAALHLYRKDLNYTDDDVDFLVPAEHFHRVKLILREKNIPVFYETSYFLQTAGLAQDGGGPIDIYQDPGDPQYFCDRQTELAFPRSMIEPYSRWDITENSTAITVAMPSKIEDFLVASYGEDFRVPQPGKKSQEGTDPGKVFWEDNCRAYHGKRERNKACGTKWHGLNQWCHS